VKLDSGSQSVTPYPPAALDRERRGEDATDDNSNERSLIHHSITSSARCRSDGGIVRPRAFAVLRLMTSSNLVGCSMGSNWSRTLMRLRLGGQASGHFPTAPSEPAPDPAKQPSHLAWHSRNTTGSLAGRTRPTRDQQPRRRVPARTTDTPVLGLAGPALPEPPDEGREIRKMSDGDICGGG
jgi:hypothetical protein